MIKTFECNSYMPNYDVIACWDYLVSKDIDPDDVISVVEMQGFETFDGYKGMFKYNYP